MNKRDQILDAFLTLIIQSKGAACSVSDIAKQANIGKGSIYYYFKSKEEIMDALVDREYEIVINQCKAIVESSGLPAIQKFGLLYQSYYSKSVESAMDLYLHDPQNAAIHQKSLAKILKALTPILADIIEQGIKETVFQCTYPREFSEIILSELCFVFDPGIFSWTPANLLVKAKALSEVLERSLQAPAHSFDFLWNQKVL